MPRRPRPLAVGAVTQDSRTVLQVLDGDKERTRAVGTSCATRFRHRVGPDRYRHGRRTVAHEVMARAEKAGFGVHPTGLEHGTVTLVAGGAVASDDAEEGRCDLRAARRSSVRHGLEKNGAARFRDERYAGADGDCSIRWAGWPVPCAPGAFHRGCRCADRRGPAAGLSLFPVLRHAWRGDVRRRSACRLRAGGGNAGSDFRRASGLGNAQASRCAALHKGAGGDVQALHPAAGPRSARRACRPRSSRCRGRGVAHGDFCRAGNGHIPAANRLAALEQSAPAGRAVRQRCGSGC